MPASISGLAYGARDLAAFRIHGNNSDALVRHHLNNSRSVGFVLDYLRKSTGPLRGKLADCLDSTEYFASQNRVNNVHLRIVREDRSVLR